MILGKRKEKGIPDPGFAGCAVSDVGCVRGNNEDNYILGGYLNAGSEDYSFRLVSGERGAWHFAGVFDGMGGGEKGEVASLQTARIFLDTIARLGPEPDRAGVDRAMRAAFLEANNHIAELRRVCRVFGTTGTVLCANRGEFKLYHLGDSRGYLLRGHKLRLLTKDQTLAQLRLDAGLPPGSEANRHILTDYIGRDETREQLRPVETEWLPVHSGDRVLLCSDGLYDLCGEGEMERILRRTPGMEAQARALTAAARRGGGYDNITCILAAL